eukprot:10369443-Ditylum_brightwellii.AAC.1
MVVGGAAAVVTGDSKLRRLARALVLATRYLAGRVLAALRDSIMAMRLRLCASNSEWEGMDGSPSEKSRELTGCLFRIM